MAVLLVVGARPNFMKAAPLVSALRARGVDVTLVHTGQHYDAAMSEGFFAELGLPAPDVRLDVGSGSNAEQIGLTMQRLAPVVRAARPWMVLVVGDVNATVAGALVAAAAGVLLAHVEAGLRSFDRTMPEEVNRVVTDALAAVHFTPSREAGDNLRAEGIAAAGIHFVGNIMIDTLVAHLDAARTGGARARHGVRAGGYALVTVHRPASVDTQEALRRLLEVIEWLQVRLPVVFPVHPRTRRRLDESGLGRRLEGLAAVRTLPPLGYREFLALEADAAVVLTDSGGVQEETTFLGVPCLTLRPSTERPVTVREGTNRIVGSDPADVIAALEVVLDVPRRPVRVPELWDGRTAPRIADVIVAMADGHPGSAAPGESAGMHGMRPV
jgi:UDP-N-acetylglucosamine 2-epimerase (non-hydrolysing)